MTAVGQPRGAAHARRLRIPGVRWRKLLIAVTSLAVVLGFAVFTVSWYYSNTLHDEVFQPHPDSEHFGIRVLAVPSGATGTITLAPDKPDPNGLWRKAGTFGVKWPGGYGQVTEILELSDTQVTRAFTLMEGALTPGTMVRMDAFAFPADPLRGLGLPFEDVIYQSPLGAISAWYIPAASLTDTWAILVHGHRSDLRDMLRDAAIVHDAGMNALDIHYRNDNGSPRDPDGDFHFGETEWQDLAGAIAYAQEHGAQALVLVGHSMGGAIIMSYLERSPTPAIRAVILDAPMLDLDAAIRHQAKGRAPDPVIRFGIWASAIRFRIDWDALNYIEGAGRLSAPILVFHGDADNKVPVTLSRKLAAARPDLVTLAETPGMGHVQSWNYDPAAYRASVLAFLEAQGLSR